MDWTEWRGKKEEDVPTTKTELGDMLGDRKEFIERVVLEKAQE
jgi:hypothetical protein